MAAAVSQAPIPLSHHLGQPDISYAPDWEKYLLRTKRRLESEEEKLHLKGLPAGFPRKLESSFVWEGKDLVEGKYQWVYELSEPEVDEIEKALRHFKCVVFSPPLPIGFPELVDSLTYSPPHSSPSLRRRELLI